MTESISRSGDQDPLATTSPGEEQAHNIHFIFNAPKSYFLPSLATTNPATFDPTTTNFGLIPQKYDSDTTHDRRHEEHFTDWQRFALHLSSLNANSPSNTAYHVLYLARHGQGYHNLAESYYGTKAWDCYWAQLDGDPDSNITWEDAHLSKLGQRQAREQSRFWAAQLDEQKMPAPSKWFVSPMDRACKTAELTFEPLARNGVVKSWQPIVKEFLRETNGIHTCDRRSPSSVIASRYPHYVIEDGFTERDELWDSVYRETEEAHTYRALLILDDIFSQHEAQKGTAYVSLTAHGGMINAILRAIGHRQFQVQVGSAIAVLVKSEKQESNREHRNFARGKTKPECAEDPLNAGLPGYKNLKDYVDKVEADAGSAT